MANSKAKEMEETRAQTVTYRSREEVFPKPHDNGVSQLEPFHSLSLQDGRLEPRSSLNAQKMGGAHRRLLLETYINHYAVSIAVIILVIIDVSFLVARNDTTANVLCTCSCFSLSALFHLPCLTRGRPPPLKQTVSLVILCLFVVEISIRWVCFL